MNIILPLAGQNPRFKALPKPLIQVGGRPFVAHILKQLQIKPEDKLIVILLQEHIEKFHIDEALRSVTADLGISTTMPVLPAVTQGSPCSILEAARNLIDNDTALLVELGDVIRDLDNFYRDVAARRGDVAGIIPVERRDMSGRPFGYVRADAQGTAEVLLEKEMTYVAPWATMGLYYFSHGRDFVWAVDEMVRQRSFVYNNMFFVGPVYNELIGRGDKVIISENKIEKMLGTPEEVENFCWQHD